MKNSGEDLWAVVSLLQRSLGHAIRTPLSVISNELQYLSAQFGEEECSRALLKCGEISDILGRLNGRLRCGPEPLPLKEIISAFQAQGFTVQGQEDSPGLSLHPTWAQVPQLCSSLADALSVSSRVLVVGARFHLPGMFSLTSQEERSLCSFFVEKFPEKDLLEPVLLEVLMSHAKATARVAGNALVLG